MSQLGVFGVGVRTLSLVLGAGALIGAVGGCFITNTAHCGYHENGADNPCPPGYVCSVCAVENNGCVAEDLAGSIAPSCRDSGTTSETTMMTASTQSTTETTVEPPTGTSLDTTTTTTVGPTSTTEPVDTTTETSTTEAPSTTLMTECDPNVPADPACLETMQYCVAPDQCGFCMSLVEKTCADVDPLTPACDSASGQCVECTADDKQACGGSKPACEGNTCVPCTTHDQCPATACDIETGECFPEESIVYVKGATLGCLDSDGTLAKPYCSLSAAQAALAEGQKTTIMILPGQTKMAGLSLNTGDYAVAIRHAPEMQNPEIDGTNNLVPTLEVRSGNRVYLWRVKFNITSGKSLINCTQSIPGQPGILYLDETKLTSNGSRDEWGIEASGCKIRMRRSLAAQLGSGIQVSGGSLRVESSLFYQNGDTNYPFGALSFISPESVEIVYSTLLDHPLTNSASTFKCAGTKPAAGVVVRNSAILNLEPLESATCAGWVTQTGSLVQGAATQAELDATRALWFGSKMGDNYPVKKDGPLKDVAMWGAGDPVRDYDTTPIPQDGPSYAGHDQPPQ